MIFHNVAVFIFDLTNEALVSIRNFKNMFTGGIIDLKWVFTMHFIIPFAVCKEH